MRQRQGQDVYIIIAVAKYLTNNVREKGFILTPSLRGREGLALEG